MPHAEPWIPDELQLTGNLHHLRGLLDNRGVPRVMTIPELARVAELLRPRLRGLDGVLAVVNLAIDNLPDDRGQVAEHLYGLTDESRGKPVKERRQLAVAKYQELTGKPYSFESFRTNDERALIADLAMVLIRIVKESHSTSPTDPETALSGGTVREHAHTPLAEDQENDRLKRDFSHRESSADTEALPPRGTTPVKQRLPAPDELTDEIAQQTFTFVDHLVFPGRRLLSSYVESTCDWLYGELLGYLVDVLGKVLVDFLDQGDADTPKLEPRREGSRATRVFVHDAVYVIAAQTRLLRPSEVDVALTVPATARPVPTTQLLLSHEGRFVLASLALSPDIAGAQPWAEAAIRGVLDSGDRAIEAFVVGQLAFDVTGAVAQLYSLVRRYFSREIADTIRLFLLDPRSGGGMHLDDATRQATLNSLRTDPGVEGISPAEKLLRLALARFPVADSVAAEIIPSMQTVVRSPLRIPSARAVGAIQSDLFGHELILQPLLNADRLWIEAGYPARLRSVIEPVLEQYRSAIAERACELDFEPALREPIGEAFDIAAARDRRREQFQKTFGHLIAGYPTPPS